MGASSPIHPLWGQSSGAGGAVMVPPNLLPPGHQAGDLVPSVPHVLLLPLPEDSPIPSAQEFNALGSIATAAVQNDVAIPLLPANTLNVPPNMMGVIRGFNIFITNMLAATNVTWTFRLDGVPVPGYQDLSIFPRVAPFVGNSFDAKFRFNGPVTISVTFDNIDGGAYTVGAAVSGWYWPVGADIIWKARGE